jgi:hypothetical protein
MPVDVKRHGHFASPFYPLAFCCIPPPSNPPPPSPSLLLLLVPHYFFFFVPAAVGHIKRKEKLSSSRLLLRPPPPLSCRDAALSVVMVWSRKRRNKKNKQTKTLRCSGVEGYAAVVELSCCVVKLYTSLLCIACNTRQNKQRQQRPQCISTSLRCGRPSEKLKAGKKRSEMNEDSTLPVGLLLPACLGFFFLLQSLIHANKGKLTKR